MQLLEPVRHSALRRGALKAAARSRRAWRGLGANARGAAWLLVGVVFITVMVVLVKMLEGRFNPFQITFVRAAAASLFLLPVYRRVGLAGLRTRRPLLLLARSVMATLSIAMVLYAIAHMPLADVQAITFASVLFMVPLAVFFLGERIGARRWGAALVGFVGVLIILRPSADISLAALAALASAFLFSTTTMAVKLLARDMPPTPIFLYGTGLMAVIAAPFAVWTWRAPNLEEWLILLGVAFFGASAQFCRVRAISMAETTAIAPLDYTRLIFAVIAGVMLFGERPDAWTYVGSAVIAGATLYITWREARLVKERGAGQAAAAAAAAPER